MIRIIANDALVAIPELVAEGLQVDSVVTDPPYHLQARTSRFGKEGSAPPQHGKDGAMGRLSKGFMGKTWDGGDVAFRPETWATIATAMRPGAFLLSFGGTRTYHRVACAIEDGGLVIQDCIMWLYGTGFPKRRDMLKPAYEPIVLAYKPGGVRTMQIDECRIGTADNLNGGSYSPGGKSGPLPGDTRIGAALGLFQAGSKPDHEFQQPEGRWPANICHDGSDEVVSMFPIANSSRANGNPNNPKHGKNTSHTSWEFGPLKETNDYRDEGSAARFFWSPKAGKKDRVGSRHPTIKPVRLLDWLVPLVTPVGGTVLDPFAGSGTTGVAAQNTGRNAILIEREPEYVADIRRRFPTMEEAIRELTVAIRSRISEARGY